MEIVRNIAYAPAHGERGQLDLVLMIGFILVPERVRVIVDISGPATRSRASEDSPREGKDPRLSMAPVDLVGPGTPPLLAVHSRVDGVVNPAASTAVVERVQEAGGHAELLTHVEDRIARFLSEWL